MSNLYQVLFSTSKTSFYQQFFGETDLYFFGTLRSFYCFSVNAVYFSFGGFSHISLSLGCQ